MSKLFESRCSSEPFFYSQSEDYSLASILKAEETALFVGDENEPGTKGGKRVESVFPDWHCNVVDSFVTDRKEETKAVYKAFAVLGRTFIKTIPRIIDAVAEIIADSIQK